MEKKRVCDISCLNGRYTVGEFKNYKLYKQVTCLSFEQLFTVRSSAFQEVECT